MRTIVILFVAAFLIVLAGGCYSRMADVTAISTKSVMVPGERLGEVEGVEKCHIYCIFPDKRLSVKEAIDKALKKQNADMLVDAKFYVKSWYIPFIYGQVSIKVTGTAVRLAPKPVRKIEPPKTPAPPASSTTPEPPKPAAP
jgi:hypothetical protein